jgi:hypothetical protein
MIVALVLDTADRAERDRAEALREAMRTAGVPANVTPFQTPTVLARLKPWSVDGHGTARMHRVGTGLRLQRTMRQVRSQLRIDQLARSSARPSTPMAT